MRTARKKKVFISSTVLDFADFRSALRCWLEERGCEVFMSEDADFPAASDRSSYDACLKVIEDVDCFILLIGGRRGGWYDKDKNISITHAEYLKAREVSQSRPLPIVTLVRRSVWDAREDRKPLRADGGGRHASKIVDDPDAIFGLIDAVAQTDAMKAAVEAKSPYPTGNWIYQFSSFRHAIESVRVALSLPTSLEVEVLSANLRAEIRRNLALCLRKGKSAVVAPSAGRARWQLRGAAGERSSVRVADLRQLILFWSEMPRAADVETDALTEAIHSGAFLELNPVSHALREGPLQLAMVRLLQDIRRLPKLMAFRKQETWELLEEVQPIRGEGVLAIDNLRLFTLFAVSDCWENIVNSWGAIARALAGDLKPLASLKLNPRSPFKRVNEEEELFAAKEPDIDRWLQEFWPTLPVHFMTDTQVEELLKK